MTTATLSGRQPVLADLIPGVLTRDVALVVGGAAITGVAAQIAVHTPLSPVPFTLQTLSVLVIGAAFGPLRALLSMLTYLIAGMAGVPWFAGHAHGIHDNPSFGYLVGFVVAGAVLGLLSRRGNDRQVLSTLGLFVIGDGVVFLVGTVWLGVALHVSASQAISLGVTPFLATEALKVAVAALALPAAWRLVRR
jgi:biotin transport system substrate-specific component